MDWKNQLTKTPYLVLFIVLITVGVGTASALITITLAGDVIITDNLHVGKDLFIGDSESNQDILFFDNGSPQGERFQWDDAADRFEFSDDGAFFGSLSAGSISSERPEGQNSGNFIVQRSGGPTSENTQFVLSHRNTNKDMWLYAYDGTTFKNFVGFDYPNYIIRFPSTGDTLVVDVANDQVTIEGKDFEMGWNSRVPSNNVITTVDSIGSVGGQSSITVGVDGLPVISYLEDFISHEDLKVAKCTNQFCSSPTITTVDTGEGGRYTSISIGVDGYPVIAYYDSANDDLKVAKCTNISCTSFTKTTVDDFQDIGVTLSMAIGVDGNPVISYHHQSSTHALRVAKCTNPSCTDSTISIVDSDGIVGQWSSIAIGVDGNPVISYKDGSINGNLNVLHCGDIDCAETTNNNTITTVDTSGDVGFDTSLTIGVDGKPVISYRESFNNGALKIVHCGDLNCTETINSNTITTVDSVNTGKFSSITIGMDGYPVISYQDGLPNAVLKIAKCHNITCTSSTITTVDTSTTSPRGTSITIGTDGNPLISYQNTQGFDLNMAKCANPYCIPNWIRR